MAVFIILVHAESTEVLSFPESQCFYSLTVEYTILKVMEGL